MSGNSENLADSFYALTPDRIHEACLEAGLSLEPGVTFLNSLENRVARLQDEDGKRWVAKFYRPNRWTLKALEEEHRFTQELQEAGLPVVSPIALKRGATVGTVEGIFYSIFPHLAGRQPDEVDLPIAFSLGQLLGKLHQIGREREFRHRPSWDPRAWAQQSIAILEQEQVVPAGIWRQYQVCLQQLTRQLHEAFAKVPFHRIHGDLHRGNLMQNSQGLHLVDFDDCGSGPAVQDVWLLIPGRDDDSIQVRELLIDGYQTILPFPRAQLNLIESLRALKFVHYAAWLSRRRKDPIFARKFPDIESHSFWRRELEDLQAQMEICSGRFAD